MTDGYFELASLDHFWVARRFQVFRKLAGDLVVSAREMAEIGCGHGLVQRQIEQTYNRQLTGFDLNETGLKHNLSSISRVCCYDIYQRGSLFKELFDLIFLWDVIEHIRDEDRFLDAVLFHLSSKGKLIVNVPAGEWAFSAYDRAAGHFRRYSAYSMQQTAARNKLEIDRWTYWGLPLVPTLVARKLWLAGKRNLSEAYSFGFAIRSSSINNALGFLAKLEMVPQGIAGTSLMAVLQRKDRG